MRDSVITEIYGLCTMWSIKTDCNSCVSLNLTILMEKIKQKHNTKSMNTHQNLSALLKLIYSGSSKNCSN